MSPDDVYIWAEKLGCALLVLGLPLALVVSLIAWAVR